MSHHDHMCPGPPQRDFIGRKFRLAPCFADVGHALMGIGTGAAVSGKMLEGRRHASRVQSLRKGRAVRRHPLGISGKRPPQTAYGRRVGIDVHVEHGREIKIDPRRMEHPPQTPGAFPGRLRAFPPQIFRRGESGKTVGRAKARHLSAFLIHAHKQGDVLRRRAQGAGQAPKLRRIADIAGGGRLAGHRG